MNQCQSLNRRDFVKAAGAAAAAGALSAAGIAHAEEAAPAATDSWMPEIWDAEADAVIIGYGCAGPIAAIALADQGFTSLLIEKADRENAGGDCCVCGGYILAGGDRTAESYIIATLNAVSEEFAQTAFARDNAARDYLKEIGVQIDPDMPMVVPQGDEPRGVALYNYIVAAVESRADMITVMYETPGVGLVQNPVTKEVYGVRAGGGEAPVYLKANRGVVVATGSYGGDREMTNRVHAPGLLFPTIGSPYNTGDGLKMLLDAGCKAQNFGKSLEYAAMAHRQGSEEVGTGLTLPAAHPAGSYIYVNRTGKRFMDETANLQHSKTDAKFQYNQFIGENHSDMENTGYPNAPAFMVFDQAMMEAGPVADVDGAGMGWVIHGLYTWSADNQAELERGWIVQADTLEELAEKVSATDMWGNEVHINPAGLAEQVAAYNALCDEGVDTEFGRTDGTLAPIGEGPYYAFEIVPATLYTTGGAACDINAQAVDWHDQPIPRLYMAGLVGNSWTVHSSAVAGAVAWARTAAEQIAQLEPWE